jgi:anaerobic selenocysteine-containing dehydrogenase
MWKRAVCAKDCPDTCGFLVQVQGNRIVKVKGDPDHPYTRGFICKKAIHFPAHVHSSERITSPLKRTGEKGAGEFTPVSWDEALDEVASKLGGVQAEFGGEAILPYYYAGHMGLVQRNSGHAFFNRLGASHLLATICGPAATAGFQASLGKGPSTEIQVAAHSDFIIIWGSNTLVTNVHAWPHFARARKDGAVVTVIDPYANQTAKASDRHLMIRPGTDAALALSMMQVIIAHDLIDRDFIHRHTLGFEDLKDRAALYPPDRAARICGIDAKAIVELALGYARARAPYIRTGWGPARQLAGGMAMRTIALLPALVGAFAATGGGITRSLGGAPAQDPMLGTDLRPGPVRQINMVELGNALTKLDAPPIKVLYNYLSNPAVVAPQSRRVHKGLGRQDLFVVVQEMFMTDTARFADIILPGASFFEVTDLYRSYGHNYIQVADPVIPPVGKSRSTLSIFQSLARRMGFEDQIFSRTESEWIAQILKDDSPFMSGVDLDGLAQGRAVRLNIPSNPYEEGFNTPSGRVEFFSKEMAARGLDPLPSGAVIRDPEGGQDYPFEFITPSHPMLLNSAFNEVAAIQKRLGPPRVLIHPKTAKALDIRDGKMVRVFNNRGECRLAAKLTTDTREKLLVAEGLHWPCRYPGSGANALTSQRLTDMGQTCAFHCSRVAVRPI